MKESQHAKKMNKDIEQSASYKPTSIHGFAACSDPENFVREGGTTILADDGREDPNTTKSGPSSAKRFWS